jgi:acyl-CoA synthetase (AMP-forming)/AMP-acid ligase II
MADLITEVRELQPPGELTNRELWHWRVQRTPDRLWLWYAGQTWSYGEFDLEVRRLAAGLGELGVGPGTRVLVGMSSRPETVATHLALADLGAVRVLLVPGLPFEELMFPIVHSEAQVMIADDPIASLVLSRREDCPTIEHLVVLADGDMGAGPGVESFNELAQSQPLDHAPLEADSQQALSYIVYTSGSTGRPKGVMLKAGSLYHCGLGYSDLYGFRARDIYFQPLTFGHSLASIAGLGIPMVTGGSVALVERFRPSKFWADVRASGATISVLFPAHLNLLLETDDGSIPKGGSSLRFVVTHTDIPAFRDRFGVELGVIWGMSETLVCVGSDPGYRGELGPGYVGHPFAGAEVGIFDPDFQRLGPYQYGELCLRHPMVMHGYLKDPEATATTLSDGWVRSGDRGYIDHSGRAYFAGRYKAMIKRSGENVSAEEVEAALNEHPDVAESVVVSVPDRLRTEEVGAVVVRRAGTNGDPARLREACSERLVRWKLPRYILVRDEPLPRLGNGKIDRTSAAALIDPESVWDAEKS